MQHELVRLRVLCGSLAAVAMTVAIVAACGDSNFVDDQSDASSQDGATEGSIDDASLPDASAIDGSVIVDDSGCGGLHGPSMVRIPGAPSYCIDSMEVSRAQYGDFVMAIANKSYTPSADPRCSFDKDFNDTCALAPGDTGGPDFPRTCVDWCDALTYCAYAGKHLCGRIGGGGSLSFAESVDYENSEWANACTANNTRTYPYGSTYTTGLCNMSKPDASANKLADLGPLSFPLCVGGYPGISDMAGNVSEWVNGCDDADASDLGGNNCAILGDSFDQAALSPPGQCIDYLEAPRAYEKNDLGFRCCAD